MYYFPLFKKFFPVLCYVFVCPGIHGSCKTALNDWLCRRKDNKQKEALCSSRFAMELTWSAEFEHQNNDAKYQLSLLSESISKWSI